MGAAAFYVHVWLVSVLPGNAEIIRIVRVFGAIGVALVVLAASARLLRIDEFTAVTARVMNRIRR
jgi:hypothetical protein